MIKNGIKNKNKKDATLLEPIFFDRFFCPTGIPNKALPFQKKWLIRVLFLSRISNPPLPADSCSSILN